VQYNNRLLSREIEGIRNNLVILLILLCFFYAFNPNKLKNPQTSYFNPNLAIIELWHTQSLWKRSYLLYYLNDFVHLQISHQLIFSFSFFQKNISRTNLCNILFSLSLHRILKKPNPSIDSNPSSILCYKIVVFTWSFTQCLKISISVIF
jgi:hypothetical protein